MADGVAAAPGCRGAPAAVPPGAPQSVTARQPRTAGAAAACGPAAPLRLRRDRRATPRQSGGGVGPAASVNGDTAEEVRRPGGVGSAAAVAPLGSGTAVASRRRAAAVASRPPQRSGRATPAAITARLGEGVESSAPSTRGPLGRAASDSAAREGEEMTREVRPRQQPAGTAEPSRPPRSRRQARDYTTKKKTHTHKHTHQVISQVRCASTRLPVDALSQVQREVAQCSGHAA